MPKEQPTPIPRGTGTVSPDFTAPSVGVVTPGRQLTPQTTEQEAFRDAILTFGAGVASAVSARAAINSRIASLKETSMRKVEADLNRSARSFQAQRLEKADKTRREILEEAGEKGIDWAEREFRSHMTNAASGQEAQLWEQAWSRAAAQVDRSNSEAQRQSFNNAKMSMQEVGLQLSQELQEAPALQETLKGDGLNINARVQNWMLTRVQREVDMDALDSEDAEFLIHQTIVQASRIGDQLRSEHASAVEDSNARLGSRQIEADLFSTLAGDQAPQHIREQIEVTLRDRFSHMTLDQQDDMVREMVASNLQKLASGDFGIENFGTLESARELLNLTVNGRKVYTPAERSQLEAKLFQQAERTIALDMEARLTQAREKFSKVITLPDGNQVVRPDLDADSKLITPDPDTGVSPLDRIASQVLGDIASGDDPTSARLIGAVRNIQARMAAGSGRAAAKAQAEWAAAVNVLSGGISENPTSDGNLAHNIVPETKAIRTDAELTANGRVGLSVQEDRHLRESYKQIAVMTGMDPTLVDNWRGETIGSDHPLRSIADIAQASLWNNPEVVKNTGMPPALVRDKIALMSSDSPEDLRSFGVFITTLDGGPGGAYQKFMSSSALTDTERAQAIHVRTVLQRGRADFDIDGNPVIQSPSAEATDISFLHSQVQQLANIPQRKDWLYARPDGPRKPTNLERIAGYWAEAVRADDDPRMYSEADWEENRDAMVEGLTTAISNDSALADWVSATFQSQSSLDHALDEGQVAAVLKGWMERDGLRFKQAGAGQVFIMQDPANHTGPPGQDLDTHALGKLTTPYPAWVRDVIGRALGARPIETPETIQGLYLYGRKGKVSGGGILPDATRPLTLEDARVEGLLTAHYGNTFQDAQRRLDRREDVGGAVLHAVTSTGERLQLPAAVHRVEFTYPDGTPGVIEEGQILSVVNSDFVPSPAPKPRTRKGGYVVPAFSAPFNPRLTPDASSQTINVPSP